MKELTILITNFTESEEKKENNFSHSRKFHMYTFGFKWFKKPLWLINVKFYDVIVTDIPVDTRLHFNVDTKSL